MMLGAIADQPFPVTPPAFGIQSGPNLDLKVECADLLDIVADPLAHSGGETRRDRANRVSRLGDAGDRVLRVGCPLYIGKEEDPSIGFEPLSEFPGDAGLSHAPLSSQEGVWLPLRTRVSSIFSSGSRSKKSLPLTQRPVEDCIVGPHSTRLSYMSI